MCLGVCMYVCICTYLSVYLIDGRQATWQLISSWLAEKDVTELQQNLQPVSLTDQKISLSLFLLFSFSLSFSFSGSDEVQSWIRGWQTDGRFKRLLYSLKFLFKLTHELCIHVHLHTQRTSTSKSSSQLRNTVNQCVNDTTIIALHTLCSSM